MASAFFPAGYDEADKLAYTFLVAVTAASGVGLAVIGALFLTGNVP